MLSYKLLCLAATITIVVLSITSSNIEAASASTISSNHRDTVLATKFRLPYGSRRRGINSAISTNSQSIPNAVTKRRSRQDTNSINLWNFRSFNKLQVPPSSSHQGCASRGRRRGAYCRNSHDDNDVMAVTTASSRTSQAINPYDDPDNIPSLEEMRAQLGPIGRLIANSVEVGIATAGSYVSGGIFGYVAGGIMGTPTLFRNSPPTPPTPPPANGMVSTPPPPIDPNAAGQNIGTSIGNRIKALNSRAVTQAGSWAQLSAAFSGFHALTRVCRGGVEDKWNGIIGSAFTGAYLSRSGGPQAMVQGASTYMGFTYLIDVFFGSKDGSKQGGDGEEAGTFDFSDTPLEDHGF